MAHGVIPLLERFTYVTDNATHAFVRTPWVSIPTDCRSAEIHWGCPAYQQGSAQITLEGSLDGTAALSLLSETFSSKTMTSAQVERPAARMRLTVKPASAGDTSLVLAAYLVLKTA